MIKGIPTLADLTAIIHRAEATINHYNKKYNFDIDLATGREREEYKAALARWDIISIRRDVLKCQTQK